MVNLLEIEETHYERIGFGSGVTRGGGLLLLLELKITDKWEVVQVEGGDEVLILEGGAGHIRKLEGLENWTEEAMGAVGTLGFTNTVI